jgi:glycerol-3-phosphate dehydrogenase
LALLGSSRFDVLVVGGGITGSAVAEEAARRGVSVALIERDDFAVGASGHSSKLLHGGLRYLAQGKVGLVREALRERGRLLAELDPAWTHPMPFLLPLNGSVGSRMRNRFGTWLYERLAGRRRLGPRTILDRAEVLRMVPQLDPHGLRGGILYWEAIVDDVALTLFRIRSAGEHGAVVANHVEALAAVSDPEGGVRVRARDLLSGEELTIRSRWIVDATGAWMGRVPLLSENAPRLAPSKGIHLVFRREMLPTDVAVVLEGPDGRPTFVLPLGSLVVAGTTDTPYSGDPSDARAGPPDLDYLFQTLRTGFPSVPFSAAELVDVYTGVRPLMAATATTTSELSREDVEAFDRSGRVAVAGGKLTTHEAMARRAVRMLPIPPEAPGSSRGTSVAGRTAILPKGPIPLSEGTELLARLVRRPEPAEWNDLRLRVVDAMDAGQAETLEDVVDRRLHALNRREKGFDEVVEVIAGIIAERRGLSNAEREQLLGAYRARRQREYGGGVATA